jgi:sulfite exporter TauE/SafE
LPCPILYPVYLYALARGSPVAGAVSLALVGLGTFPTLFASGLAVGALDGIAPTNRVRLHRVLGVAFLLLGYIPLAHGLMLLGVDLLPHVHIPVYQPLG